MAFWPFGRKSKRSNTTRDTSSADAEVKALEPTSGDYKSSMGEGRRTIRKDSRRRNYEASNRIPTAQQSNARDPEKETPAKARPIPAHRTVAAHGERYANEKSHLPSQLSRGNVDLNAAPPNRGDVPSYYFQNTTSQSSLQPENFTALKRPPTLRAKRDANENTLPRRKSGKRKAEDRVREQEIKAMSSAAPVPKHALTHSGSPFRRDTPNLHGGLNRHRERPTSDTSLPLPDSINSSMSEASDQRAFRVSALDVFTPRPTLRYSDHSRYGTASNSWNPSRASTRKEKRATIPEDTIKQRKRIDDLADDMDASSIRELMDRDRRRREKKAQSDHEKLHRKLQRRADKQKEEARNGKERGDGSYGRNPERGVLGREQLGRDIDESSVSNPHRVVPSPHAEDERHSPESWLQDPSKENLVPDNPFVDPTPEGDVQRTEEQSPTEELEEPVIGTANVIRLSQHSMSPPTSPRQHPRQHVRGPSNLSTVTDLARQSTSEPLQRSEPDRRKSDTSGKAAGSWTSFFKRGGTRGKRHSVDQDRVTPEFSNTSRESFARQPPPVAFQRNVRTKSGAPVRTQSKFREDLPELPLSPPDSRVQSPEMLLHSRSHLSDRAVSPLADTSSLAPGSSIMDAPLGDIHPAYRQEIAQIRQQIITAPSPEPEPSSALLSQSLASVDSEGSWLSGRPVKHTSLPPNRGSIGSLQKRLDVFSNSDEELAVTEDEYFNRIHPGLAQHRENESELSNALHPTQGNGNGNGNSHGQRKASSTAMANESDESDVDHLNDENVHRREKPPPLPDLDFDRALPVKDEGTWHGAIGRQPTIVRNNGPRAKSREGLLNDFVSAQHDDHDAIHGERHRAQTVIIDKDDNIHPLVGNRAFDPDNTKTNTTTNPTAINSTNLHPQTANPDRTRHPDPDPDPDPNANSPLPSPDTPSPTENDMDVQRARSVDFKGHGHVRHISAGSAKLLDLPPRTSLASDGKRLSGASGASVVGVS